MIHAVAKRLESIILTESIPSYMGRMASLRSLKIKITYFYPSVTSPISIIKAFMKDTGRNLEETIMKLSERNW